MSALAQPDALPEMWLELSNDILVPEPDGPQQAPTPVSAQDAAILMEAFQKLIDFTVSRRAGAKTPYLPESQRRRYEVVIAEAIVGSLKIKWKSKLSINSQETQEEVKRTFDWVSRATIEIDSNFGDQLNLPDSIDKGELVASILETIALAIPVAANPHDALLWAPLALDLIAKISRVALANNRQVRTGIGDRTLYNPSGRQAHALVEADKLVKKSPRNRVSREGSVELGPGTIEYVARGEEAIYVQFEEYAEPIKCLYEPGHEYDPYDGRHRPFQSNERLTIVGRAVYARGKKGKRKRAIPQFIVIEEVRWL